MEKIQEVVDFIESVGADRVSLQFPDNMLQLSIQIVKQLKNKTKAKLYIMADTSYAPCCVDVVAAKHVFAQAIVHYGESCHSDVAGIPVFYVFQNKDINVQNVCKQMMEMKRNKQKGIRLEGKYIFMTVLVFYDSCYVHAIPEIKTTINDEHFLFPDFTSDPTLLSINGFCFQVPYCSSLSEMKETLKNYCALFIGNSNSTLFSMLCLFHFNNLSITLYDPNNKIEPVLADSQSIINSSRVLNRRYYLMNSAKQSQIFGVVVGTLSTHTYMDLLKTCTSLLKSKGKTCLTISVGKPTIAKLGNFTEVDCFVWLSCPMSCILADEKEFMKPVITPWELFVALGEHEWDGTYTSQSDQLLKVVKSDLSVPVDSVTTLAKRCDTTLALGDVVDQALVDNMNARTFKGVQIDLGTEPASITKGLSGIARHYE